MYKCGRVVCLCFLLLIELTKDAEAQDSRRPAKDFSRHSIVQPVVHHARTRRELSSTRDTSGAHHPEVTVRVAVGDEEYVLDLRLNRGLVPEGHTVRYQKDGQMVELKPGKEEIDLCHYNGKVRDKPDSWVAVSTCHGLSGVIYDGEAMKYIQPVEGNDIQAAHFVYDHKDLNKEYRCGYGGVTNSTGYDPLLLKVQEQKKLMDGSRAARYKRDTSTVRGPYNSNEISRYVELVLVADHSEFIASGESLDTVRHQLKEVANIINSVYSPLNIFIALVGVEVWTEHDRIELLEDGDRTLTNFLIYRKSDLIRRINNDNAQLLTRQKFNGSVVGKALKGPICTYEFSGGVATNHSDVIGLVATTIAHEMGHNFGMEHDDVNCACPDEKCIMNGASTSVVPVHWSACSLRSLALAFERGMDYCLRNKPKQLFDSPTCGNGFVEAGEQCDCGMSLPGEANPCAACCHPETCMLRVNATCASGACCDLQSCRPKRAGTVCRFTDKECDLPEYCSGRSEYCPEDVFKMDATPCGKTGNEAYCVGGSCRSRGDQCRLLWGATGEDSHPRCYKANNPRGDKNGNCGYDRLRQIYARCSEADTGCGLLQCRHLNERLEFGMESMATLAAVFINLNGTIMPCRTAIIDLGLGDVDPGMVPDGAKCGEDMMCMKQRCVPVDEVRTAVMALGDGCPGGCGGHGVCNSKGNCHCEAGYAPPDCTLPGPGGSEESGPATDPGHQRDFMMAMYIIFLGIIPTILLILFLFYYTRRNSPNWWKKPKKSSQSPKKASLPRRLSLSASKFASNFQNNSQGGAPPTNVHTLSNPDDMSSSLLRCDTDHSPSGQLNPTVNFFGNFKGFSLTPMEKNAPTHEQSEEIAIISKEKTHPKMADKSAKITPVHRSSSNSQSFMHQGMLKPVMRSAPPLPVVPVTAKTSPKSSPNVKRSNSTVQNRIKALMSVDKPEETPSVLNNPPPRPVISSPILEASTCTAKELISPLQGSKTLGPVRAAPSVPALSPDLPKRPLSMHSAGNVPTKPLPEEPKKVREGISLNRIASFLRHDKPKEKVRNQVERSNSLPKNPNHQIKLPKTVDKAALRNLQISNPILQKDIDLPVGTVSVVSDSEDVDDGKGFVNRAQSMRAPAGVKPVIQSFGSMRQAPGVPRPVSIAGRPTAPPPPLPHQEQTPIYQNPKPQPEIKSTDYVDCIEEKQAPLAHIDEESSDNIYAIIEESPEKHSRPFPKAPPIKTIPTNLTPEGYNTPKAIPSNSGSTESMGLLGEIVDEIQNRNFDSIYSASTLSRKKKAKESADSKRDSNNSTYMNTEHYKTPESVYSNSGAKSSASTTSSGYLHPSAVNVPTYMNKESEQDPKIDEKAPPSPNVKPGTKIPTFARQVTPPALKTSSFRNVPQSPKNNIRNGNLQASKISNSPDVVSSCAVEKNIKPPDVINNNKLEAETPAIATKPSVKSNDNRPPLRPAPSVDKKPALKTVPSLKPVIPSSNLNKAPSDKTPINRTNSKVDNNVKALADNLNKNKPKIVAKPASVVSRTDSNVRPNATKLSAKPSNVASLQQKFENRKSFGKDIGVGKK